MEFNIPFADVNPGMLIGSYIAYPSIRINPQAA